MSDTLNECPIHSTNVRYTQLMSDTLQFVGDLPNTQRPRIFFDIECAARHRQTEVYRTLVECIGHSWKTEKPPTLSRWSLRASKPRSRHGFHLDTHPRIGSTNSKQLVVGSIQHLSIEHAAIRVSIFAYRVGSTHF